MLLGGNGGVVWAEQFVPSGLAALLVATVPLWVVLLVWITGRDRPSLLVVAGLLVGFCGVFFLVGPERIAGGSRVDPHGALVLVLAALAWAMGSLYSRDAHQAPSHPR
jgi:drug/metabolite transporter (DMT)-like permease